MLTDYHVHLRPDEDGTTAERYFTRANAERYREAAAERGIEELGVAEHIHRFTQALDVWQHPWWRQWAARRHRRVLRLRAGRRPAARHRGGLRARARGPNGELLDARRGTTWSARSTSCATRRWTWRDGRQAWDIWRASDPEKVWGRYFETLGEAARTGMFDILAHPDLVKVWGDRVPVPDGDLRRFYELAMDGIADCDVAIEVSTAGLRKPVGEIYPAPASWRCASMPAARWRCRATPTCPSSSATSTSGRWSGWAGSG